MATPYDAVVIGTGQSGPSLAVDLAQAGRQVAVIERHRFGGTCVNTGCIPTKTAGGERQGCVRCATRGGVRYGDPGRPVCRVDGSPFGKKVMKLRPVTDDGSPVRS